MRRQEQPPIVVIQTVIVRWTKQSRGGKAAQERNQVPEQLELPAELPEQRGAVAHQKVIYAERNQFREPVYQEWNRRAMADSEQMTITLYSDDDNGFRMPGLLLSVNNGLLDVGIDWTTFYGAPRRYPKIDPSTLAPGEWLQFRCNARSSGGYVDEETWSYMKLVVNVSYAASFSPTLFCSSAPTYQRSDMADLW